MMGLFACQNTGIGSAVAVDSYGRTSESLNADRRRCDCRWAERFVARRKAFCTEVRRSLSRVTISAYCAGSRFGSSFLGHASGLRARSAGVDHIVSTGRSVAEKAWVLILD
jgi:hypothetical protein